MKDKNIQDNANPVPLQGLGVNSPSGDGGQAEKGKTAKYLREQLGGIPEQAKDNLKEFNRVKKTLLEALKEGELTVTQIADKVNMPAHEVMFYLMSLVKYGFVKTGTIDDMDEYFTYKLSN